MSQQKGAITVAISALLCIASPQIAAYAQGPNSWTMGAPVPVAVGAAAAGAINGLVYVVGGATNIASVNANQIYNPGTDTWTTGAPMPTARQGAGAAVVNDILYVFGGKPNVSACPQAYCQLTVVEAYDPATDTWSTKSPMPTPKDSIAVVAVGEIIYVIGGFLNGTGRLTSVESYDAATDTWTELAPLSLGKSYSAGGLLGSTIVAAGGLTNSGSVTGDNEGYNPSTNAWKTLAPDPTARQADCAGVVSGQLVVAGGGNNSGVIGVVESFSLAENQWTTLAPMPTATSSIGAVVGDLLYCFGTGTVQIYHPSAPPTPAISAGGVVSASAFGGFPSVAPGSWIEIYGSNLALDTRPWAGSDFNGVNAPTSLDGTSVMIGGEVAFIDYISPGQVNAQVPFDVATGLQQITLKTGGGTSSPLNVTVNALQPGLLAPASFDLDGIQYAVALFSDGTYVLPTGAISGINSLPAKPGDTIVLYGVGFGPVTPDIPAGQIVQQSNTLKSKLQVSIGGKPATVSYSGLAPNYVGLYQFNVVVPNIAASDAVPLTFTLDGAAGTQTLYIAVQN